MPGPWYSFTHPAPPWACVLPGAEVVTRHLTHLGKLHFTTSRPDDHLALHRYVADTTARSMLPSCTPARPLRMRKGEHAALGPGDEAGALEDGEMVEIVGRQRALQALGDGAHSQRLSGHGDLVKQ
jgi:hypothetical protein